MSQQTKPTIVRRLRSHAANILTLVSAALILFAVLFLSPWVDQSSMVRSQLEAQGIQLPDAAQSASRFGQSGVNPFAGEQSTAAGGGVTTPPQLPSGSATGGQFPMAGSAMPGASSASQTPTWANLLLVGAAVMAAGAAVWSWLDPRRNRNIALIIVLAGLVALLHFAYFFGVQNRANAVGLIPYLSPGFWIALVGTVGLFVQSIFKRPTVTSTLNGTTLVARPARRRGSIGLGQNIAVAFDALLANKLRSLLTMLGIVIGVMAVVALISVGQGATSDITSQIEGIGTNLITVSPAFGSFRANMMMGPMGGGSNNRLTLSDAEAIEYAVVGLAGVAPQYSSNATVTANDASYDAQVIGTAPAYATIRNINVDLGRFFDQDEYDSKDRVVVLGSDVAAELFGSLNPVGYEVRIDNRPYQVVGVLEKQDTGFGGSANEQVYIPLTTGYRYLFNARAVVGTEYQVSSITLSAANSDQVSAVISQVETLLREQHDLSEDEDNDFTVSTQEQLLETFSTVSNTLSVLLGAIAGISLFVGGIGIMNISLVSVTERTKEIGLRKALGARRFHILQQFLIETVVLSTMGGIVGVLAGAGIAVLVNNSGLLNAVVVPGAVLLGLGFSVAVGVFFGVYPANRAASLHPIEALRYE